MSKKKKYCQCTLCKMYVTKKGLLKKQVDIANNLWIAVQPKYEYEALEWFRNRNSENRDKSFWGEYNVEEGILEIKKKRGRLRPL